MQKDELISSLSERQQVFDHLLALWQDEYRQMGGTIFCHAGCQACCKLAVNCTLPEAMLILPTLNTEQRARVADYAGRAQSIAFESSSLKEWLKRYRQEMGGCPFLDAAGHCSIYPVRPLSCRSLLSTRESHWCATDFGTVAPSKRDQYLAGLDQRVVAYPTHYAATPQEVGRELEEATLRAGSHALGSSALGLMLYLLWLEDHHQLSTQLQTGVVPAKRYLEEHQLANPYLLLITDDSD